MNSSSFGILNIVGQRDPKAKSLGASELDEAILFFKDMIIFLGPVSK